MEGLATGAALVGIFVVIFIGIWIKDKIVDGITDGVTTGINKVVQSGNHSLGKEMVAEEIQATSTASPDEVITAVLTVLNLPDYKPTTVNAGLFGIRADDEGILFGAGGITGVSFTSMMAVESNGVGSTIGYTVVEWKVDSGVIAHAKLMSTLSEGVRFALTQLPGIVFTIDDGATPVAELPRAVAAVMPAAHDVDMIAVSDPTTEAASLTEIAARRHDLLGGIAAHPSVYPELLEWIAQQEVPDVVDDPDVRALADSATEAATLTEIAARRHDLLADIVAHPSVYPALLEWIAQQEVPAKAPDVVDDPDVRALADTATEPAALADIAARRRDLWSAVSAHPSLYAGLAEWIAQQEPASEEAVLVSPEGAR